MRHSGHFVSSGFPGGRDPIAGSHASSARLDFVLCTRTTELVNFTRYSSHEAASGFGVPLAQAPVMSNSPDALKARTKTFALAVLAFARRGPPGQSSTHLARQLVRSATAVGANYRAALRSRSRAEFVSRVGVVLEEADEAAFWLELLSEELPQSLSATGRNDRQTVLRLLEEANQLTAIFAATRITAQSRDTGKSD